MENDSITPLSERYFEDYAIGATLEVGTITVDQDEMIAFARRYDPQPFHTDPEAAAHSIYGGLIASGWHTAAMMMRLIVEHYLPRKASLGSPGVDELRWSRPVRPGDRLTVRVTVLDTKRSRSKPDRGALTSFVEVLNQERQVVMSMKAVNFLLCRDHAGQNEATRPE